MREPLTKSEQKHVDKYEEIVKKYHAMTINLEALYQGEDPFAKEKDERVSEEDQDLTADKVGF